MKLVYSSLALMFILLTVAFGVWWIVAPKLLLLISVISFGVAALVFIYLLGRYTAKQERKKLK